MRRLTEAEKNRLRSKIRDQQKRHLQIIRQTLQRNDKAMREHTEIAMGDLGLLVGGVSGVVKWIFDR